MDELSLVEDIDCIVRPIDARAEETHNGANNKPRGSHESSKNDLKRQRLQEAFGKVAKYNSTHPLEQTALFFAIAIILGCSARLSGLGILGQLQLLLVLGAITWLVQERLAVVALGLEDPLIIHPIQSVPPASVGQDDAVSHRLHRETSTAGASGEIKSPVESSSPRLERADSAGSASSLPRSSDGTLAQASDEFWSFTRCIQHSLPPREYNQRQEAAIQEIQECYFNPQKWSLWQKSRYLCVNDDSRAGAIRALVARNFDVEKTSEMIENTLAWREKERVNDIFRQVLSPGDVFKMRLALGDGFCALDKTGHPIWWCPAGAVYLNALKAEVPLDRLTLLHMMMMEFNQRVWYRALSKHQGRCVYQATIVLDLTGFGVSNVRGGFYECFNTIGNIDRDYYYENVHRVYIIHAPSFFRFFWKTISPLFEPDTREKFQFLSSPKDLHAFIDPRYIPKRFGGRCSAKDVTFTKRIGETIYTRHMDAFLKCYREGGCVDEDEYVSRLEFKTS